MSPAAAISPMSTVTRNCRVGSNTAVTGGCGTPSRPSISLTPREYRSSNFMTIKRGEYPNNCPAGAVWLRLHISHRVLYSERSTADLGDATLCALYVMKG